jgi:hypothetical protein
MASVINRPNGHKWIRFFNVDGKRQTIKLGKALSKTAAEVCRRVELLLEARLANTACDRETAAWLAKAGDKLRNRLAHLGLIDKPATNEKRPNLGAFLEAYIVGRGDVKHWTKTNYEQSRRTLVAYFGENRDITTITAGDATNGVPGCCALSSRAAGVGVSTRHAGTAAGPSSFSE